MKKILFILVSCIFLFSMFCGFAESPKSVGVTDNDVKNWAKNIKVIEKELSQFGWSVDNNDVPVSAEKKVKDILQKNGISGSNNIEKFMMISQCAVLLVAEIELDEKSKAIMQAMNLDPFIELRKNVNSKDYNVVASNSKEVIAAFDQIEADKDDYGGYDNDEEDDYDFYMSQYEDMQKRIMKGSYSSKMEDEESLLKNNFFDSMKKSKGDCGVIYSSEKYVGAASYRKKSITENKLYVSGSEIDGLIDFKNNTIVFRNPENEQVIQKYNIKIVEYYEAVSEYDYTCWEYVIFTKEGLVLHLWQATSFDGNEISTRVKFNGIKDYDAYKNYFSLYYDE